MTPAAALGELYRAGVAVRLGPCGAVLLKAAQEPPAALLVLARTHRDGIRALLRGGDADAGPALASLPGVPADWCEGVAALATMAVPSGIAAERWGELAHASGRLVRDHGAALHGAGWGTLHLFGLHRHCPATYPPGWGLAWLLDADGDVLDVMPDGVAMRRTPKGARLVFRRRALDPGVVSAWELDPG